MVDLLNGSQIVVGTLLPPDVITAINSTTLVVSQHGNCNSGRYSHMPENSGSQLAIMVFAGATNQPTRNVSQGQLKCVVLLPPKADSFLG